MIRRPSTSPMLVAMGCLVVAGCARKDAKLQMVAGPTSVSAQTSVAPEGAAPGSAHDPSHPPIDCPLHKQGIDTTHMRPFEDAAKYIEFLERADRVQWQKPDAVVRVFGLRGDEVVFDLGAGSGYFSFPFASAVPQGKVIAADTEPEMIRHVHHRAMSEGVRNVEVRLIQAEDPAVDPTADLVFVCDVLHHVTDRRSWLSKMVSKMKPGARLALIEFKEGQLPQGPPEGAKIPRDELLSLVSGAGLALEKEHEGLLPYQVFFVFRKP